MHNVLYKWLLWALIGLAVALFIFPKLNTETPTYDITEPVTTAETVADPTETFEIEYYYDYYDVPLDVDLQTHIIDLCRKYDIDPAIVVALIERESEYDDQAVGDKGKSLGLMQVQPKWHSDRMKKLGCEDLLDPYQNVEVGIDYLAELFSTGKSTYWVLMAYNGGYSYADEKVAQNGITWYAVAIMRRADELRGEVTIE